MDAIGYVEFYHDGEEYRASLSVSGSWEITPEMPEGESWGYLRRLEGIEPYRGPSDGRFGPRHLEEAARILDGEVTLHPTDPGPPGRVY